MGSKLLYYLLIKPLSLLPYWVLYGISDFFFIILFYFVGYRKKVVRNNLEMCFPEKSDREIQSLMVRFYRHFCDLIVESIKNFSITDEAARRRMKTRNPEVLDRWAEAGRNVILAGGHYGNWELWAVAGPQQLKHKIVGIYKPLNNKYFDRKLRETRAKFGLELIPTKETGKYMRSNPDKLDAVVFGIDQSPSNPNRAIWVRFMGMDTACLPGTEHYARELNRPIIFAHLVRTKRGHFEVWYEEMFDKPAETKEGEITTKLHEVLEKDIRQAPEYWLWSHKRWKHRYKPQQV
jgi:KDO2-lipid IV(A) lauroyltransferase